MKNILPFNMIVLVTLLSFANVFGQGASMKPILTDALAYINVAEDNGYEIVRMEFDIVSSTKSTYRELQRGWTYGIIAFGDYRIDDIDIKVYKDINGTWTLIQKDNSAKPNAAVDITPVYTGMYRIDIVAYKFAPGYSAAHYGLLIFHE